MVLSLFAACGSKDTSSNDSTNDSTNTDTSAENNTSTEEDNTEEVSSDDEKVTLSVLAGQSTTDAGIEDMIDEALAKSILI